MENFNAIHGSYMPFGSVGRGRGGSIINEEGVGGT